MAKPCVSNCIDSKMNLDERRTIVRLHEGGKPNLNLHDRVIRAAEAVLKSRGSVGPLELLQEMRLLHPGHFENWRKGHEGYEVLEPWIQVGQGKLQKAIEYFQGWVHERGLRPMEARYDRRGPRGIERLRITADGGPEKERFYHTHYTSGELTEKQAVRLAAKLKRPPELVVFEKVSEEGNCAECGAELVAGDLFLMEKRRPLCLACADLDRLVFLPAGDTALSRRARLHSPLSAVVVRFSRARKRYERQGLLVTEAGLARAETECTADADIRAAARGRAALARQEEDREFIMAFTRAIQQRYPGCPAEEARQIAGHTGQRSSGRVGRSAGGKALEVAAVDLAVRAHLRHARTNYDELLMSGMERLEARAVVRERIDQLLVEWSHTGTKVTSQF